MITTRMCAIVSASSRGAPSAISRSISAGIHGRVSVMRTKASMKRSSFAAGVSVEDAMPSTIAPILLKPSARTAR